MKANIKKKILYMYHDGEDKLLKAVETERVFSVREAMDRLASAGMSPMPGYDIARKLVYNWVSEDGAVEAFIL